MALYDFLSKLGDVVNDMAAEAQKKQAKMQSRAAAEYEKKLNEFASYSDNELKDIIKSDRPQVVRAAAYQNYKANHTNKATDNMYRVESLKGPTINGKSNENDDSFTVNASDAIQKPKKTQAQGKKRSEQQLEDWEQWEPSEKDLEEFDIIEDVWDFDGTEKSYRKTALFFTEKNHGWIQCPKCGRHFRAKQMDADHIYPKSKGGDNSPYNLQMLCQHCNRSKQDNTSDTDVDLERRYQELEQMKREDYEFLSIIDKMLKEEE